MWNFLCLFSQDTELKLSSEEALATVEALASLLSVDIASVEAKHASNREISHMYGKGWLPSLQSLSARFISHTVSGLANLSKRLGLRERKGRQSKQDEAGNVEAIAKIEKKQLKRGGGAWRAYVHHCLKGQRLTAAGVSQLAESYKNLPPSQKAIFQEAGEKATQAHRAGLQPFQSARWQPQKSPLLTANEMLQVGDVTASGAIVAASDALQTELQFQCSGDDAFLSGFQQLKRRVNQEAKAANADFSTAEEKQLLESMGASTQNLSYVAMLEQGHHTDAAAGFRISGSRLRSLFAADWFPSVAPAAKAWITVPKKQLS